MQIRNIRKCFEVFEHKFEPFKRDSKLSKPHSNHFKGIRTIPMQIRIIRKGFEAFKFNFKPFERDLRHSNANSNHSKGIRSIRMQILTIRKGLKLSTPNSNHSKWILIFQIQFLNFRKGFEAFECKFKPFERDSRHLNANSNHSKGIRSIRIHSSSKLNHSKWT